MTTPQTITSEIQKLEPSAIMEFFVMDASAFGGDVLRFHAGTNGLRSNVVWQGNTYTAFPVQASGFDYSGNGQLPRPKLQVANITGAISLLVLTYDDLLGAKITRKRTLAKYLDSANFPDGQVPGPSVAVTRSSVGSYVGSDGLLKTAAANAPRFDYDPVTLAPKGILIEEQRTNLLLNSLIDGTNLATQTVTVTAQAYTLSFYGTGTVTLSGAYAATVTGFGAYPTRTKLTFTPTAGSLVCTVSGTVQFANLEAGAFSTSFIPTAGATVTRTADAASLSGTSFSSWYNQPAGTFLVEFTPDQAAVNNNTRVMATTSGTINNRVTDIYYGGTSWQNYNGTTNTAIGAGGVTSTPQKIAVAYATGDYGYCLNGGTVATQTAATVNSPTQLVIGNLNGALTYLNGHIRRITYYSRRLTNAELQAITGTGSVADLKAMYVDFTTGSLTIQVIGKLNPTADVTAEFADDIFLIDRKATETRDMVEFELAAAFDVAGVQLPRRQIIQNVCTWRYRGGECGYTGTAYFDANDASVAGAGQDVCGKRLSSCKARFGATAPLPFGSFPAAGLTR